MQIYEQTSEINKACLVISQRVQAMFARSANIGTNERDKQGCLVISQRVQAMFARSANIRTNNQVLHKQPAYFSNQAKLSAKPDL